MFDPSQHCWEGSFVWSSLAVGHPNGNMVLTVLNLHIIALFSQGGSYKLRAVEIVQRVADGNAAPRGYPQLLLERLHQAVCTMPNSLFDNYIFWLEQHSFVPPYYFWSNFFGLLLLYHNSNIMSKSYPPGSARGIVVSSQTFSPSVIPLLSNGIIIL